MRHRKCPLQSTIVVVVWYGMVRERERLTRLTALCPWLPGWAGTRKVNQSGFYWSKRQWVAVASAGPYASLHLAPDRHHASTPPLSFLQAGCPSCRPTNSVKALKAWYCMVNVDSYSAIITIVYHALVDPRTTMLMKYVFVRKIEKVVRGSRRLQKTELEDYSSALWCRPNIDMVWSHIARRQWFARSAWS